MSQRGDRNVFRAHGFLCPTGRETDHHCTSKLQTLDLALQMVKPHSPQFLGTVLQGDRWDSYSNHHVSTFLYELAVYRSGPLRVNPLVLELLGNSRKLKSLCADPLNFAFLLLLSNRSNADRV